MRVASFLVLALAACGGADSTAIDGPIAPDARVADAAPPDARLPDAAPPPDANLAILSQAGLYGDFASKTIDPRLRTYTPRFTLWADSLEKRRFIDLPAGGKITTTDMEHWQFPVGTRLWKEFSTVDGKLLETRLLEKTGDSTWKMGAYVWRADGSDADYTEAGAPAVRGTDHDVPSGDDCFRCHQGEAGRVLGFSALQLGEAEVAKLAAAGLLTEAPAAGTVFALPWDDKTNAAFGYLHANCGHCHNPRGSAYFVGMTLRLSLADLLLADRTRTAPWLATVGVRTASFQGADYRVVPHDSAASALVIRMSSRADTVAMPPLATKHVDADGVAIITAWIDSL